MKPKKIIGKETSFSQVNQTEKSTTTLSCDFEKPFLFELEIGGSKRLFRVILKDVCCEEVVRVARIPKVKWLKASEL